MRICQESVGIWQNIDVRGLQGVQRTYVSLVDGISTV